jgi:hypothetical protein
VTVCTQTGLQAGAQIWRNVLEETAAALFRIGNAKREVWSRAPVQREPPQRG